MPRDIISINTTHYVSNNMYKVKLPKAVQFKKSDKLSLYSFSMYNSFYNISASQYGNSNITFTWFDNTVYNWTIPDGYYSLSDLNLWLQQQFILNKLYCVNSNNSQNIYFVVFQTNSVLYKAQIDVYYMPSTTNAALYGYTVPSGASWTFPASNTMVTLTINQNLQSFFGITNQLTFGNITPVQNMHYLSNTCPIVSPVFSIFLGCNLIVSDFNQIGNLFSQFPISAAYGNLIKIESSIDSLISIKEGIYSEIVITLWDQNNKPLIFQDPELTVFLIISTDE
jgi:hypothetical protein